MSQKKKIRWHRGRKHGILEGRIKVNAKERRLGR